MSALMGDFQVPYGAEVGIVEYCGEFRKARGARQLEAMGDARTAPRSFAVNLNGLRKLKQVTIHLD